MKLNSFFVILLFLGKVESYSKSVKADSLRKAFSAILETLSTRNHVITVVIGGRMNNAAVAAAFAATASIPHNVERFSNRQLILSTSAIVSLESK